MSTAAHLVGLQRVREAAAQLVDGGLEVVALAEEEAGDLRLHLVAQRVEEDEDHQRRHDGVEEVGPLVAVLAVGEHLPVDEAVVDAREDEGEQR
jgi:hypothetical protein